MKMSFVFLIAWWVLVVPFLFFWGGGVGRRGEYLILVLQNPQKSLEKSAP